MASEDAPDVEILLAELVSRPAWHRQAAWRRSEAVPFLHGLWVDRPEAAVQNLPTVTEYAERGWAVMKCAAEPLPSARRGWSVMTLSERADRHNPLGHPRIHDLMWHETKVNSIVRAEP